jgi:membrane dipeptidase
MKPVLQSVLILSILLACFVSFAQSQEITLFGIVKDKSSEAPLDSAVVEIKLPSLDQDVSTVTNLDGSWSYNFQITDVQENNSIPYSFALGQNYPNPFNPSTRIYFSIFQAGDVKIEVYNLLGQRLDSKSVFLAPGDYFVDWYTKGASGVLFYSIEMKNQRLVRKMLQLDGGNGGLGKVYSGSMESKTSSLAKIASINTIIFVSKLGYEPDSTTITISNDTQVDFLLDLLHTKAFVVDLHNDVLEKVVGNGYQLGVRHSYNHSDIPRFFEGGVDAQMFVVWVDPNHYVNNAYQEALQFVSAFNDQISLNANFLAQARNADEIFQINAQQKLAGVMVVEGGHAIENDLEKLKNLYNQGMRYMTITWNNSTDWATSAQDPQSATKGLSEFGKQVIRTLDSLGVIIDVSHVGIKTIQDILSITKNPIIASHSGVRALRNHYRNLYDDQIVAIANTGGVIGVVFYPTFLSSSRNVDISTVIKHIDYIVNLVGIDYVALGSDFDGIESTPVGLEDASKFPDLTMALLKHGYSNTEVKKILGENFLRVFRQVCH